MKYIFLFFDKYLNIEIALKIVIFILAMLVPIILSITYFNYYKKDGFVPFWILLLLGSTFMFLIYVFIRYINRLDYFKFHEPTVNKEIKGNIQNSEIKIHNDIQITKDEILGEISELSKELKVDERQKILLDKRFSLTQLCRVCEEYFSKYIPKADAYSFVKDCIGYEKNVLGKNIDMSKFDLNKEVCFNRLDREEFLDLVNFILYLKKKNVFVNSNRNINSIPKIVKSLDENYPFYNINSDNLKKLLKNGLPKKIEEHLNLILAKNNFL